MIVKSLCCRGFRGSVATELFLKEKTDKHLLHLAKFHRLQGFTLAFSGVAKGNPQPAQVALSSAFRIKSRVA